MQKIKAGIIGASGYAGAELYRILLRHPLAEPVSLSSGRNEGKGIDGLYPSFHEIGMDTLVGEEELIYSSDVIFGALPHGLSESIAARCIKMGKKFIDLGADFRLEKEEDYKAWYGLDFTEKRLHEESVYGLSELYRSSIGTARIIANPGCYPTAAALGLYPIVKEKAYRSSHIIIDAKSGVTGAGKEPGERTHFPRTNEAFSPYKAPNHRHTPEIGQSLSKIAREPMTVTFVPHLLPVNRGILSTMYVSLKEEFNDIKRIAALYHEAYGREYFVRILPEGAYADIKYIQQSNYCDISLHLDERNSLLIIVSAIDNMMKGAAGQAVQNMNIMYGFPEESGIDFIPSPF